MNGQASNKELWATIVIILLMGFFSLFAVLSLIK